MTLRNAFCTFLRTYRTARYRNSLASLSCFARPGMAVQRAKPSMGSTDAITRTPAPRQVARREKGPARWRHRHQDDSGAGRVSVIRGDGGGPTSARQLTLHTQPPLLERSCKRSLDGPGEKGVLDRPRFTGPPPPRASSAN